MANGSSLVEGSAVQLAIIEVAEFCEKKASRMYAYSPNPHALRILDSPSLVDQQG